MGACFSYELDEQHSFHTEPEGPKSDPESLSSVVVIRKDVKKKNSGYSNLDKFTYDEMRMATQLFNKKQILGEGRFGVVYKGIIDESVRSGYATTEVAIKQLNHAGLQGEKEWRTELNYLARLHHPNLVKLIGYCYEKEHRLLVYEYMSAGSLEDNLFVRKGSKHTLSWSQRMKIALDAAKGLAYLHNSERPVIYRDFKASNILLDADFNAKLSDFGIAKDGPVGKNTHVSTQIVGTQGYTAPDYLRTGHLRASCDLYAFGVVLLELMMGLPAIDRSRPGIQHSMTDWARPILTHKRELLEIMDPRIDGQYPSKHAVKVAKIVHQCIHQSYVMRPLMDQVLETLESVQKHEAPVQSEVGSVTAPDPRRNGKSSKR